MKKICVLLSIILCIVSFSGCSKSGDISNVEIVSIESKYFSQDDIYKAIDVVYAKFSGFTGCTLTKIGYIGDEVMCDYLPNGVHNNPSYIVLDCEFETSALASEDGFNSNETYQYGCWKWYLEKDAFGNWKIDNYGMA